MATSNGTGNKTNNPALFGPGHYTLIAFSIIFILFPCIYIPVSGFVSLYDYKHRTKNQCYPLYDSPDVSDRAASIHKYIDESDDGKSVWPFNVYCRKTHPPNATVSIFDTI